MEYTLVRRKRMQSVKIKVDHTGAVIASAPHGVPQSFITSFVLKNSNWIERQQHTLALKGEMYPILDWQRRVVSYKGKLLSFRLDLSISERVRVGQQNLYIHPATGLPAHLKRTLLRWLKGQAETYISQRIDYWHIIMSTTHSSLTFRQQKSRWGSCGPKNELSFNWRLIHFKPEVIDYVVIHELAHTRHHNHSPRFWQLVRQYQPDFEHHRAFLKKQVVILEKI